MACQYVKCSEDSAFVLLQTLNPVHFMGHDSPVFKCFKHCTWDDIASGGNAAEGIMLMLERRG